MRILAAADFHGKGHRYESFFAGAAAMQPDIAVLAGDVNSNPALYSLLDNLDVPALVVHGNMDSMTIGARIADTDRAIFLHNRVHEQDGLSFIGLGGASPQTDRVTPVGGTETLKLDAVACDVLVTHLPPKGVKDAAMLGRHIGSDWVRAFIMERHPRIVICGHVHEDRGHAWLNDTLVVNCTVGKDGAYSVIDVGSKVAVRHEKL